MFDLLRKGLIVTAVAGSLIGCSGTMTPSGTDDDDDVVDDSDDQPPGPDADVVDPPPPPPPATYKRGSLSPVYQLTPPGEYGRMAHKGIIMADSDFQTVEVGVSASNKMDEITGVIQADPGHASAPAIIRENEDRRRADFIPFRGNPSDVKFLTVGADTKAYIPLGGDTMTPGNEVAVVRVSGNEQVLDRIKVGVHPQRLAVHPAGLIFVCNQFSNYISIIDPTQDELLKFGADVVEVPTEYYCGDLTFVDVNPLQPDEDEQLLLVANRWRNTLLIYRIETERGGLDNKVTALTSTLVREVNGVGKSPIRLSLDDQKANVYVVSNRGGDISKVNIAANVAGSAPSTGVVAARLNAGTPVLDAVVINDKVFMTARMIDRGLIDQNEQEVPQQVQAQPVLVDGAQAHPGAIFDRTKAYNFEDVRSGILQYNLNLNNRQYFTDTESPEPNFGADQKILDGSSPMSATRNAAGTRLWVTMGGTNEVQEIEVRTAQNRALRRIANNGTFATRERPFQLAADEANNRLYVVSWGGETLEIFNLANKQKLEELDLGYAQPRYPATNIERGEFFYYNAEWSNTDDKSCESCHVDDLITDGFGYSNGASTPTGYHQVKPNYNLSTTNGYFWAGGMNNGDYTSVAFAAQTRTNCELIEFGLVEGPSSEAAQRIGDPNIKIRNAAQDAQCRPDDFDPATRLPANFAQITANVAAQKILRNQRIQQDTGFTADEVSRFMDFYSVSELRLPPNPLAQLAKWGELDATTTAELAAGKATFQTALCGSCHPSDNSRHPFTNGENVGNGASWTSQFIQQYQNDPRVLALLPAGFPQNFLEGDTGSPPTDTVNIHLNPIAYFIPLCFQADNCLAFEDPLVVQGSAEETRRLELITQVNLVDPERQFIPGNVPGQPMINVPSLRGVWTQYGLLHTAYARNLYEAILKPGHPALRAGEKGYAWSNTGKADKHGVTSNLSGEDIRKLELYVNSIE